jgi:hypothetical protein
MFLIYHLSSELYRTPDDGIHPPVLPVSGVHWSLEPIVPRALIRIICKVNTP